ncbi:MAG: caspase family protein [Chlorobi bacterium]|nr:caspase family protein [Chlorobiota bacterium]
MKKITTIIVSLLISTAIFATDNKIIISSYDGHNAEILITESSFEDNSFKVTFYINWINSKLKKIKDENSVLAILNDSVKIFPENSVGISSQSPVSDFSNKKITLEFFAKPDFEGGNVKIVFPFVFARNIEEAKKGNWKEVLYSKEKHPAISYNIDGKLIKDIYAPEVRLTSPAVAKNSDEKIPVVDTKIADIRISAYDKSGVKEILINNRKAKLNYTGEYTSEVTLYTGLNIIRVKASDNFGNVKETEFKIICSYQYDINLRGGKFYALIVGINDYKDINIPDLDKPVSDAEALKNILVNLYTFDEENVFFLKNVTRSKFIKKLDELAGNLTDNDNLLIFYAGHGYWDDFREIGYWMPSDAVVGDNSTWIRNSTIKEYIGSIKTKQTLLITDACFGGSIFKTRGLNTERVVAYQKIYDLPGRKGMTSGTLKEVPDVSIFLHTLLKRLKSNEDKYLTSSSLFNSLRDAVLNNSPNVPQFGTIQGVGDEGGEFIFIKR